MRSASRIAPQEAFQIAAEWLQYQVTTPIDTGGSKCKYLDLDLSTNHSIREQDIHASFVHLIWNWRMYIYKTTCALTLTVCIVPAQTAEGMCSFLSPSVLQWEAMTTFMDCTVWQILKSVQEEVIVK